MTLVALVEVVRSNKIEMNRSELVKKTGLYVSKLDLGN